MSKARDELNILRNLSDEELLRRVDELKRTLFALRSLVKIEGKGNSGQIRNAKKEIARILTIIRERQISKEKNTYKK
ncbi:50S ribosomal protein L29 [bacterium HR19]|nr:50S ribosomal protein L29 [bacterium HR19]